MSKTFLIPADARAVTTQYHAIIAQVFSRTDPGLIKVEPSTTHKTHAMVAAVHSLTHAFKLLFTKPLTLAFSSMVTQNY